MWKEILIRFLIGGTTVSVFAAVGGALRPKSFAGLFGAAPSVAIATLALTLVANGALYAAAEARSMMGGAAALFVYSWCATWVMMRLNLRAHVATTVLIPLWLVVALGCWRLLS